MSDANTVIIKMGNMDIMDAIAESIDKQEWKEKGLVGTMGWFDCAAVSLLARFQILFGLYHNS